MGKKWDGAEFFRMMAANEKAVGTLYRQVATQAAFGGKFFENLAADEDRHFNIYTALLHKFEGTDTLVVDVTEEQEVYLKLLIENNWMKDADKMLAEAAKLKDKDEIYALAERAERDAVLFVEELIDLYPQLQPEEFQVVLHEEKNHLKQVLSRRMESKLTSLKL